MRLRLLSITHKAPSWIQEGYEEYAKRLPPGFALELVEISAEKRTPHADIKRITEREGKKMLAQIMPQHRVVALDVKGKSWSTEQLANELEKWQQDGRHVDLLIGGPDGLAPSCLEKAEQTWSLSPLTFPHFIVRLLVAEQIYRAWSILKQHPYHRA
jgi:23S rRNA (pseudouridine1915-N3)-methyltransferase